jgi:ribosomal protein L9
MTDENAEVNVDDLSEVSTELKAPTLDDFKPKVKKPEESKDDTEDETKGEEIDEQEDETEGEDAEQSEQEEESEEGEVLSQEIDIDEIPPEERVDYLDSIYESLDDDARREWLSNREGRVGKDMGKMRHRAAEAEAKAEAAEAKYRELQTKAVDSDNPFASITETEKLDEKAKEVDANIAAARKFLRSSDEYITVGDQEVDRETIDSWLDIYLAQKDAIPKQRDRIRSIQKAKETLESVESKLSDTYEWMKDEDNSTLKEYRTLINDPKWSMVLDFIPELAEELPKVLAKYIDGGTTTATPTKKKLPTRGQRKPKGDLGSAGSRKKVSAKAKAREALFSGSASDADRLAMFS